MTEELIEIPYRWVVTSKLVRRVTQDELTFVQEFLEMCFVNINLWDKASGKKGDTRRKTKKRVMDKLGYKKEFVLGLITSGYIARTRTREMASENDVVVRRVSGSFRQKVSLPTHVPNNLWALINHDQRFVCEQRVSRDWKILAMGCLGILGVSKKK